MTWTVTDRATRICFYGCLAAAAAALVPILVGDPSLPLMVLVLMLVYQAWRLAIGRTVTVRLDPTGLTKTVATRTWHLAWEQVTALRTTRLLGADQLVARTTDPIAWNPSDKLLWVLGRTEAAVQVPSSLVPELRSFLEGLGMALEAPPASGRS